MKTYFIEGKLEPIQVTAADFDQLGASWQSLREILSTPVDGRKSQHKS